MTEGETVAGSEVLTDRERALIDQNEAMRQELYKVALIAQGFRQDAKTYSRRQLYQDLQSANNYRFSPDYRPTNAEIFDRAIGPGNWTLIPSGEVDDRPDPTGQETPEITKWQNTKYYFFSRNLDEQRTHGTKPAHEIMQEVDARFPRLIQPEQQTGESEADRLARHAAIEDAAVRPEPEPERPEEPEAIRQARHAAIDDAAVREQPRAELPEESEEERRVRHEAIEAAATRDPSPGSEEWAAERRGASAIEEMGRFDEDVRRRGY